MLILLDKDMVKRALDAETIKGLSDISGEFILTTKGELCLTSPPQISLTSVLASAVDCGLSLRFQYTWNGEWKWKLVVAGKAVYNGVAFTESEFLVDVCEAMSKLSVNFSKRYDELRSNAQTR